MAYIIDKITINLLINFIISSFLEIKSEIVLESN